MNVTEMHNDCFASRGRITVHCLGGHLTFLVVFAVARDKVKSNMSLINHAATCAELHCGFLRAAACEIKKDVCW